MRRATAAIILFVAAMTAAAANPPAGQAVGDDVAVAAVFLDTAAVKQATGSDFPDYTVIEATVTPKGGKSVDVRPDDFLLRLGSSTDHSGPLSAAQILGSSGLMLHKEDVRAVGVDRVDTAWKGATTVGGSASASAGAVNALQAKMLPAGTTSSPVTGLLFFPMAKKKAKDLDLVYSAPAGNLHISFR